MPSFVFMFASIQAAVKVFAKSIKATVAKESKTVRPLCLHGRISGVRLPSGRPQAIIEIYVAAFLPWTKSKIYVTGVVTADRRTRITT